MNMKRIAWLFAALLAYVGLALGAVNINSATQEQLESLNGIGPVKAKAIIDYRAKYGRFTSLEDIKKVSGIGDATFDKIKGDIALTGTTVVPKADKPMEKAAQEKKETVKEKAAATRETAKEKAAASEKKETMKEKAADTKEKAKDKAADAKEKVKTADTAKETADAKKEAEKTKAEAKKTAAREKAEAKKEAAKDKADAKKKKEDDEKKK
jgi:competence protein ComEA